jgi:hypothetical protein
MILDIDVENHQAIKFLVKLSDGDYDKIMSYSELDIFVEDQQSVPVDLRYTVFPLMLFIDHQGPLPPSHKDYKSSSFNLLTQ